MALALAKPLNLNPQAPASPATGRQSGAAGSHPVSRALAGAGPGSRANACPDGRS